MRKLRFFRSLTRQITLFVLAVASSSVAAAPFDFNADGKPDLIWSNTTSGATYIWRMNGASLIAESLLATIDPAWKVQGVGDFNGDGHPDVVWRNSLNGNTYVWYLVNGVFQSDAALFSLPPEWLIQGVADFNADGKPDFLMRNATSGNAFAWFFNNNAAIGDQFLFNIDPSWKVEGVADLNADNQPDLLFRNVNSGLSFAWNSQFLTGTLSLTTSTPPIFSIDPVWEVVQVADWNADSKPDLVFRNRSTGVIFVWHLDGTTLTTSAYINQIAPSWELVPRSFANAAAANCVIKEKTVLFPTWTAGNAYNTTNAPLNDHAGYQSWAFKFPMSDLLTTSSLPNAVGAVQLYESGSPMISISITASPCDYTDAPTTLLCQRTANSGSFGISYVANGHSASDSTVSSAGYCRLSTLPAGQDFMYVNIRFAGPANIVAPTYSTCLTSSCGYFLLYQRLN